MAITKRTDYVPTLGMRGSHTWSANENPDSWREGILFLYPNGSAPLTAILSKAKSRKETEPHFHWWTKTLSRRAGDISGVNMSNGDPYTGGGKEGDSLRVDVSGVDLSNEIVRGQNVMLRVSTNHGADVVAKVSNVQRLPGGGVLDVTLLQDDTGNNLVNADRLLVISNSNPEGSVWPESVSYHPKEMENVQQIIRTPLRFTGTALNMKELRTGDQYKEAKREILEYHSIDIEQALLWGRMSQTIGYNGQPERTMRGVREFISLYNPDGEVDCARIPKYAGQSWDNFGEELLDNLMEQSFRFGKSTEKLCLAGNGVILGIQRVIKKSTTYTIQENTAEYGIKVMRLISPFGTWNFVRAPLFNHEPTNRHSMFVLDLDYLRFVYARDTDFWPDLYFGKGGPQGLDGKVEGFLTECSLELHHPELFMYISNVGRDSVLTP